MPGAAASRLLLPTGKGHRGSGTEQHLGTPAFDGVDTGASAAFSAGWHFPLAEVN